MSVPTEVQNAFSQIHDLLFTAKHSGYEAPLVADAYSGFITLREFVMSLEGFETSNCANEKCPGQGAYHEHIVYMVSEVDDYDDEDQG